uniref:Ig-like domain-containing protein n=1 Tax=Esox lucius TaxID=8010 RepID=A0A3P8XX21_ESOLU
MCRRSLATCFSYLNALFKMCNCALVAPLFVPGVLRVSGMEVFTSSEVEAVNGTDVRLKCTFKSEHPVSQSSAVVSWNFRPLAQGAEESVFYYQEKAYPPTEGRFKGHVAWSGDILRQDASIVLKDVLFAFNGTYTCQVRNLPDVHGINGEVVLKVLNKASVSEMGLLAAAIGGAIVVGLLLLAVFLVVRHCRRNNMEDLEQDEREMPETRELREGALQSKAIQENELKFNLMQEKELQAVENN